MAWRTISIERAVERCWKCTRVPVSRASARSRSTISSSASAGCAGMPSRADHSPSCMWPPAESTGSSQCWASTTPGRLAAYSMRPAHQAGVGDAGAVVGEEPHAELGHLAERGELLPRPADGDGARGAHVARRGAAELEHLAHDAGVVDGRDGVGHGEDARVAAEGGGPGAGLDRLGLLLARLAQVAVEVDEARG